MTRKGKSIVFWIITWAFLLLLVLYSPIGSPDLYRSEEIYVASQGVQFDTKSIKNTPRFNNSTDNNTNTFNVAVDNSETQKMSGYSYKSSDSKNYSDNLQSSSIQQSPYSTDYRSAEAGANSFMGDQSYLSMRSGARSVYVAPKLSNVTVSSNLLINQTNSAPMLATNDATGGTDPGGDPNNPIPVGDGWVILIVLGITYIVFKQRFFLKK